MDYLIIEGRREGYAVDQLSGTMTVGELIDYLSQFDENMPVCLGNDRQSYGWYTYGSITDDSFEEVGFNKDGEME